MSTIGCDPEGFIIQNNKIIPAETILGTRKEDEQIHNGAFLYQDGIPFEIGTEPYTCRETLMDYMSCSIERAFEHGDVLFRSAVRTEDIDLTNATQRSFASGCSPSWDAYKLCLGSKNINLRASEWQFAGCHICVGINYNDNCNFVNIMDQARFAKLCDRMVGLCGELLHPSTLNQHRRKCFGSAGEFRCHIHEHESVNRYARFEYRPLGSEIMSSPILFSGAMGVLRQAYEIFCYSPELAENITDIVSDDEIQRILNTCDKKAAFEYFLEVQDYVKNHGTTDHVSLFKDKTFDYEWEDLFDTVNPWQFFLKIAEKSLAGETIADSVEREWLGDFRCGFISGGIQKCM